MNEDFISFELAIKLKEKGFRMPCIAHYCCLDGNILKFNITIDYIRGSNVKCLNGENNIYTDAPTISQVLKWLRDEKKLHIVLPATFSENYWWEIRDFNRNISEYAEAEYQSYEQAALAGIEYILDNLI